MFMAIKQLKFNNKSTFKTTLKHEMQLITPSVVVQYSFEAFQVIFVFAKESRHFYHVLLNIFIAMSLIQGLYIEFTTLIEQLNLCFVTLTWEDNP